MPARAIGRRWNPFVAVRTVKQTIGAETSNVITVALQTTPPRRAVLRCYLTGDAAGDTLSPELPNGGVKGGTNGLLRVKTPADGVLTISTLVIDAVAEKFKTTTTSLYKIGGAQYSKAAATAIVFAAAHVITASKFGVVLVQIDPAGTVTTKVPLATQAYATAALALAALPLPDAGKVALGYIAIANNAGDWTANTDDLTAASDVTTATFVDTFGCPEFEVTTEAAGTADIVLTETRAGKTFRIAVVMPDGGLEVSGAITFA